jgi:hypothetical protein
MFNKIFFTLILILVSISCSTNGTRRPIHQSEITLSGGSYGGESWKEKIKFNRISWFRDANLSHEVLTAKLTGNSKFSNWMGSDKLQLSSCQEFQIALLYADVNSTLGTSYLLSQLTKGGYNQISILDFSQEIKSHPNYKDWKLNRHKVYGLCLKDGKGNNSVEIAIPGFKNTKVF